MMVSLSKELWSMGTLSNGQHVPDNPGEREASSWADERLDNKRSMYNSSTSSKLDRSPH